MNRIARNMNRYTRWKNMYAVPAKWQINLTCCWQKPYKDKSHIVPKNSHKDIGFALSNKQLTLHKLATRKLSLPSVLKLFGQRVAPNSINWWCNHHIVVFCYNSEPSSARSGIYFMVESHKCTGNIHSV